LFAAVLWIEPRASQVLDTLPLSYILTPKQTVLYVLDNEAYYKQLKFIYFIILYIMYRYSSS
jgi:hypothetical protein